MKKVWYQLKRRGKASLEETMCFLRGEEGVGTVEVILILVVLIGLVLVFKKQINDLVNSIFKTIKQQADKV